MTLGTDFSMYPSHPSQVFFLHGLLLQLHWKICFSCKNHDKKQLLSPYPSYPYRLSNKSYQRATDKQGGQIKAICTITKTDLYNFDPLKPHFYIVKVGFTGVYIILLISAQKRRLWALVRTASPRRL